MTTVNDGGSAYPIAPTYGPDGLMLSQGSPGMSRLDWFAGMATDADVREYFPKLANTRVQARFMHADAMLAEHTKQ